MTPKERMIAAFELREPDDIVPTWELEFQLTEEFFGRSRHGAEELARASARERERLMHENALLEVQVAERFDHSVVRVWYGGEYILDQMRVLRGYLGGDRMLCGTIGGTFGIPDGSEMEAFCCRFFDDPEGVHRDARRMRDEAVEWAKRQVDAGCEVILHPVDFCFNDGPLLSPRMFAEFVTPYLAEICEAVKAMGAWVIVHTDGDIRPILDQLVSAGPHMLHSLDPMAGVDIAEVKRRWGTRVALMGNVHCAALQTGTEEEVVESAMYCIRHAAPGGGYCFSTSNVAFKGMPPERYELMMEVRERYGRYPIERNFPPGWTGKPPLKEKDRYRREGGGAGCS